MARPPHLLLQHARQGTVSLVVSPELLAEFAEVMARPKLRAVQQRAGISGADALDQLQRMAEVVSAQPLAQPICRDPDDDHLFALAAAAGVDLLVSGDDDLLTLGAFSGVPIVTPAAALALLGSINP